MEEAEGGTRVCDGVAGDWRWNPYPELADRADAEGEVVGGQSGSGSASERIVQLAGSRLGFPSVKST